MSEQKKSLFEKGMTAEAFFGTEEGCENDFDEWDEDEYFDDDIPVGCTADGIPLNDVGLEIGLEGCVLSDEEKEIFCRR